MPIGRNIIIFQQVDWHNITMATADVGVYNWGRQDLQIQTNSLNINHQLTEDSRYWIRLTDAGTGQIYIYQAVYAGEWGDFHRFDQ